MLVRESISFTRRGDPYSSLQIGKHFLIKKWLKEYGIIDYIVNDDLTIDIKESVNLGYKNLNSFPEYIKFNKVGGGFYCHDNQLTSLEGCPSSVGGCFSCRNNQLTSLEGSPLSVGGSFSCSGNHLTSLEGSPLSVKRDFYCRNNKKQFSKEEVRKYCKVEGIIYVS